MSAGAPLATSRGRFTREELLGAVRTAAEIALWICSASMAVYCAAYYAHTHLIGTDVHAYWNAARTTTNPYQALPGTRDSYEYTPVFLLAVQPLGHLSFGCVDALWTVAEAAIFVALTRGLSLRWRVPVLLMCVPELCLGNLAGLFSATIVLGFLAPETWALPALTKITPAGTGLVWFAVRGEWRSVLRTVAATAALVAVSAAWRPTLWGDWLDFLRSSGGDHEVWIAVRCAIGVATTVLAARTGRSWLLPIAFIICAPVIGGVNQYLAMLPVVTYLWRHPHAAKGHEARE